MTNRAYITLLLGRFNLSPTDIDLVLVEATDLVMDEVMDKEKCKQALYNAFYQLIPLADVHEGDMAIKWNLEAIKFYFGGLCNDLGYENPYARKEPTIKGFKPWG